MAIPDYQSLMLPVLKLSAASEAVVGEVIERLALEYALSDDEQSALLPSGRQTTFANRVHWAKTYLGQAGLIESTGRGRFRITDEGRRVLAASPGRIDVKFLERYPQFRAFRERTRPDQEQAHSSDHAPAPNGELTPDELMRAAQKQLDAELGRELLNRIVQAPPVFFERLVIRLLTAMGYGGTTANAARALGRSGDGGVDGVIDQDPLGLDRVYVQAKRYAENSVGAGAIRDFFGALDQFRAAKGLFLTTSEFSEAAIRTARDMSKRIVLIDGDELTRLMIQHGVGCRIEETLYVKKTRRGVLRGVSPQTYSVHACRRSPVASSHAAPPPARSRRRYEGRVPTGFCLARLALVTKFTDQAGRISAQLNSDGSIR